MVVLGHRTPAMSLIYASLSDSTVKQLYQNALDRHLGPEVTMAGPAEQALREHRLDPDAVSWLQTNYLKIELELGHCLRTPAEDHGSATLCSPARCSSPPATTHPGYAPASESSSSSSMTPRSEDGSARFSDTGRLSGVMSSSSAICSNSSQWPIRLGGHHYPGLGGNRPTAR